MEEEKRELIHVYLPGIPLCVILAAGRRRETVSICGGMR